jgi:type I restriction enzyme M protein
LHKEGLYDFLKKEIEGINDKDFENKSGIDLKEAKKKILKINKHFDIKNVLDDDSFEQNHRVLLDVVKMLQKYQIRYPRKQKYLSEFFELLLTTGLKQEVGQYFTPPPIAKFIVKSLPLHKMVEQEVNRAEPKLPAVIDFAVGSGHFITEIIEEYQDIINETDAKKVKYSSAENEIISWQINPYSWASKYIYGIEKDYRLVKVAKVGCYFYGEGLAQIIHGDGLDSLTNPPKSYIGLLEQNTNTEDSTKNKFSVVVANPPYSVDNCKDDLEYIGAEKEFTLYNYLTDNSDDIECLFVERTKHLLKDGGVAGIILPSSILSNKDPEIYVKTREIILQYFDIVAVAEFGSSTFMATGKSTITLFLRRRSNAFVEQIRKNTEQLVEQYSKTREDLTINGIERPVEKYLTYTGLNIVDAEKFYYFVLSYNQKVMLIKTGKKEDEKLFLGYKFSDTKGKEGMQSMQIGNSIDETTKLYDIYHY